eukprot:RCo010656
MGCKHSTPQSPDGPTPGGCDAAAAAPTAGTFEAATLTAFDSRGELKSWKVNRRTPKDSDVFIRIHFCGICHSDLHSSRCEWPLTHHFPMTPGHEITGLVEEVGAKVTKFKR